MARPKIKGLLYFPFDIDFFEDNKIRIVKARYRSDGVMIYLFLLCEIYRQGYYIKADEDFLYIISDELGIDQNKVKQVLNFLLKKSLFNNTLFSSDKVLTSAGIQRRFQLAIKDRMRKSKESLEVGRYWLLNKQETEPFIKCTLFEENPGNIGGFSGKNECNSVEKSLNKSKENNINNNIFQPPELERAFQLYLVVRKSNFGEIPSEQVQALREDLLKLSDDPEEQLAIVKKATASGWKSFYPNRKQEKKKTQKQKTGFNNYTSGRDYEMNNLERSLLGISEGGEHGGNS